MKTLAAILVCVIAPLALSQPPTTAAPSSRPGIATPAGQNANGGQVVPKAGSPVASQPSPPEFVKIVTASIDGYVVAIPGNYAGKVVLIHVWATWCPSCAREVPYWKEAYTAFHDRGVEFLGIPTDKNRGTPAIKVQSTVQERGITWPQVYDDSAMLSMQLGAESIPLPLLVDGDTGEVFFKGNVIRKKNLAKHIEESLVLKAQRDAQRKAAAATQPAAHAATTQPK